jgi:hypothetical protein
MELVNTEAENIKTLRNVSLSFVDSLQAKEVGVVIVPDFFTWWPAVGFIKCEVSCHYSPHAQWGHVVVRISNQVPSLERFPSII